MGAVRGAIVSSVGLVLLYDVIAPVNAAGDVSNNVPTLFALPGRVADYIINPKKPLIPDLRTKSSSSSTSGKGPIIGTVPGGLGNTLGNLFSSSTTPLPNTPSNPLGALNGGGVQNV